MSVTGGTTERSCYSPTMPIPRKTMRKTTRKFCLRAAKQQTGASPVTAMAIGRFKRVFSGEGAIANFRVILN